MGQQGDMSNGLPKRLNKDPILEAVCEIRFSGSGGAAPALLPGLLTSKFGSVVPKFEALPANSIPEPIRRSETNLRYAPLVRLLGDDFAINIGENVISVSTAPRKYPGWAALQPFALSVFDAATQAGILGTIERLSVKYVNLLPATKGDRAVSEATKLIVSFGDHSLLSEPLQLRGEIRSGNFVTVVQVISAATVEVSQSEPLSGVVLDVDTICMAGSIDADQIAVVMNEAHQEEKRVFFSLITDAALNAMDPQYD